MKYVIESHICLFDPDPKSPKTRPSFLVSGWSQVYYWRLESFVFAVVEPRGRRPKVLGTLACRVENLNTPKGGSRAGIGLSRCGLGLAGQIEAGTGGAAHPEPDLLFRPPDSMDFPPE